MTNKEAIEILKQFKKCLSDVVFDEKGSEAWQMAIQALSQEPMRDFTEEEAKAYSKALDKMYKPTGFNVFDEPCTDAVELPEAVLRQLRAAKNFISATPPFMELVPTEETEQEPCDAISRILKRMWNCRGKHTTSIDKVKMERIIRDELPSVTQKPIERDDAVSREAVIKAVDAHTNEDGILDDDISVILEDLSSVTQKPKYWIDKDNKLYKMPDDMPSAPQKSGKWIYRREDKYSCSKCGTTTRVDEAGIDEKPMYKFCPYCGAYMVEPQKRSE